METLTTEGEVFKDGDDLTFTQSWNSHGVKTRGILRKRGDQWIIEYNDRGYKIEKLNDYNLKNGLVKLQKIPNVPPRPPPRILTEEEIVAKAAQEANAKEQQEIARQAEIKKKETEEDRIAETVYERIPCSSQRVNVSDRVLYNDTPATVTDVLYEITYANGEKDVVKCDGSLFNVSYAIKQNKDKLYTQRNPRGNSGWWDKGGTRKRKRKNRKTRYGLETRS